MLDLMELHREVLEAVNSNEITIEEAETLYDKMFKEQVDSLILDVYEAYLNEEITSDEINAYVGILTEAVKGDKLTKKDKSKIDDKINTLPEKEKKAVEDSIKKASKEATPKGVDYISAIKGIDNVVNKKKNAPKKDTKKKVYKESEEPMFLDLDYELAMLEGANDKDLSDEEKKALAEKKAKIKKKLKRIAAIGAAAAAVAGSAVVYNKLNDKEKAEIKRLEKFRVQTLAKEYKHELASGDSSRLEGYNKRLDEILADTDKMSTRNLFKNIKLRKDIDTSAMIEDLDAFDDFDDFESTETLEADSEEKTTLADIAIAGTIVAAIALPVAFIAKTFVAVKKGHKYYREISEIDNKIAKVNREYLDKYNDLKREWEDLHEYSSLFKKYYIPKKNKAKMVDLKERFRKNEDEYKEKVRPLISERKKFEKKYTDALTK